MGEKNNFILFFIYVNQQRVAFFFTYDILGTVGGIYSQ
jgi:hypothetical protein